METYPDAAAVPSIGDPAHHTSTSATESPFSSSASSAAASEDETRGRPKSQKLQRPNLGSRKSSGTMIVSRDTPMTVVEPDFEKDDVRAMSPRRNSEEVDRLGEAARRDLMEQARTLQRTLQAILDRIETIRSEHEKLEGGNKFLQSYIGELMQTSKITSSVPLKSKGKGRSGK